MLLLHKNGIYKKKKRETWESQVNRYGGLLPLTLGESINLEIVKSTVLGLSR